MNTDTIDLIKQLAAKFGVTVDYLWPLLVAYTWWTNLGWLVVEVLFIVGGSVAAIKMIHAASRHIVAYHAREKSGNGEKCQSGLYYYEHAWWATGFSVMAFVLGFSALMAVLSIPVALASVMVPEAKALYDLVASVSGKK